MHISVSVAIALVGLLGFVLMAVAFTLVASRGGWQRSMQPTQEGKWPIPRIMMLTEATLGVVFALGVVIERLFFSGK